MISEPNDLQLELDIKSTFSGQKIHENGRISVPKKAWILRLLIISLVLIVIIYNLFVGIKFLDPLILFSTFMPIEAVIVAIVGCFSIEIQLVQKLEMLLFQYSFLSTIKKT